MKTLLITSVAIATAMGAHAQSTERPTEADHAYAKARQAYYANFNSRAAQNLRKAQLEEAATRAAAKEAAGNAPSREATPQLVKDPSAATAGPAETPKVKEKNSALRKIKPSATIAETTDVRLLFPNNPAMWKWLSGNPSKINEYSGGRVDARKSKENAKKALVVDAK